MRVVLDSNILISAINYGGIPRDIYNLGKYKLIDIIISEPILKETSGVLERKFHYSHEITTLISSELMGSSIVVNPTKRIDEIKDDPSDNKFLEAAISGNADYIISGDKHLLNLKKYTSIKIVIPAEFLEIYNNDKL